MQWYRHDDVCLIEWRGICKHRTIPYPDGGADFGSTAVFEVMNDAFYARRVSEIPAGCNSLDAHPPPKLPGTAIVLVFMGMCIGEVVPAGSTDEPLAAYQWDIAPYAGLRKKECRQIVEVSFDKHGQSGCRRGSFFNGQLAASSIDIFSPAPADVGGYPPLPEKIRKSVNLIFGGVLEIGKGDRIVFDDIYFAG